MMSMVLFMVFWGIMVFKSRLNFWFSLLIASLYYMLMLSNSPMYFGLNFLGYECMTDTLSFSLLVLSVWLLMLMVLCSFKVLKEGVKELYFIFLMVVLLLMLILTFTSSNYIGLYIFFEASLIPTLLVITGWGYQTERLQAGIYFLFYTVVSSLPLLMVFLSFYNESGSLSLYFNFGEEMLGSHDSILGFLKFLALVSAFLVKMPLFFVHLWLPKAHVEAPVAGSMILAGVLLKLGGYGLCRVMFGLTGTMSMFSNWMVSLGLVSMLVVGFMCCRLNDMKALVAYSSIAHMGLVVAGLFIGSVLGYTGSLVMMLGHGVASSGLFSILNMYYERTGSRSFFLNKGMILILPTFSLFMFLLCASNMGAPPTMNLLSELYLLGSLMSFDWLMVYVLPLGSFMGVVFTMFLYSYSQHGKFNMSISGYWNVNMVELNSLMLHVIPLNILVLKFDLFMLWL